MDQIQQLLATEAKSLANRPLAPDNTTQPAAVTSHVVTHDARVPCTSLTGSQRPQASPAPKAHLPSPLPKHEHFLFPRAFLVVPHLLPR
jgi:hypothetical protein